MSVVNNIKCISLDEKNKNGLKLFLIDSSESSNNNPIFPKINKGESNNDKAYLSQTINAHKICNINKIVKANNVNGDFNTLLINIPNNIFKEKNEQETTNNNITNVNININIQQVELKDRMKEEPIHRKSNSKTGDINILKRERNQNFKINLDELNNINTVREKESNFRDYDIQNEKTVNYNTNPYQIEKASPSKNWRKLSNIFRSLNSLIRYDTKNLENNNDLDSDLQDYREKINTFKNRKSTIFSEDCEAQRDVPHVRNLSVEERELYRISVKERILKVIIDGTKNSMSNLQRLFSKNPDGYAKDENDPTHFYNTPLSNGKTLLYVACQEGKDEIVEFFLDKRLNAFVKSKVNDNEYESCLQVACRWNYLKIVKILLDKVAYKKPDIDEALKVDGISKNCVVLIKKYLNKFKRNSICC